MTGENGNGPVAELVSFSEDQIKLLKRTICKPAKREATNDELALFVGQCKRTGLDPFSKQIYAIFRWSKKENREVMTIQTAIDGFRVIAERTGKYMGKAATYWCGRDAEWREVWLADENPAAAKVVVRKAAGGMVAETASVAHWKEYADSQSPMWKTMPANQLAKCAEALALRQAFPNDLSGLFTVDEMGQADREMPVLIDAPAPAAEVPLSDEQRAEVGEMFDDAGIDPAMFLAAVGRSSLDELTESDLPKITAELNAYIESEREPQETEQ